MEDNCSEMEIVMKGNIKMEALMAKANIFGQTGLCIVATLSKDLEKGMGYGNQILTLAIYMKDNIKKIKNQEKGNIHGLKDVALKDNLSMI